MFTRYPSSDAVLAVDLLARQAFTVDLIEGKEGLTSATD